jgi:hypothetical protein
MEIETEMEEAAEMEMEVAVEIEMEAAAEMEMEMEAAVVTMRTMDIVKEAAEMVQTGR